MWVNLINLVKQQIIEKACPFTFNRLRHSMETKKVFLTNSINATYNKGLKTLLKKTLSQLEMKNRLWHCHLNQKRTPPQM